MKNSFIFLAGFVLGGAAGAAGAWKYAKEKFERETQEEIESVKEAFKASKTEVKTASVKKTDNNKPDLKTYTDILRREKYADHDEEEKENVPYVINPEEFGEKEDYERISLTYFADGVLTDEDKNVIDNVDETVGSDALTRFGEYEADSVYVRNDARKCDYEILLDVENFYEEGEEDIER